MPKCTGFRIFVLRPCLQLLANSCQLKQYHDFLIWWIHLRSESRDQATSADYKVFTSSNFQLIHSQGKVKGREAAWIYVTFRLPSVTKDKIFQILHTGSQLFFFAFFFNGDGYLGSAFLSKCQSKLDHLDLCFFIWNKIQTVSCWV